VLTGHFFKRLKRQIPVLRRSRERGRDALVERISDHVVGQFTRLSRLTVVVIPTDMRRIADSEEPACPPAHPECAEFARTDYCRESWQLHLAQLLEHPETHWHRCDYGRLCAVVPLTCHDECLALFKLACPASMPEPEFESHVELLDILVNHATAEQAIHVDRKSLGDPSSRPSDNQASIQARDESVPARPSHPKVLKALEYIEHSLSDPSLTVSCVAQALGIHPDYLASLFRKEVGQRMSWFISARRVERAKNLLRTTQWHVKRVACETGFANSKWFYHVFQLHTGLTPTAYRRQARA